MYCYYRIIVVYLLRYMNGIKTTISLLSPAELKAFVRYLDDRNKRHDTRNIAFIKALEKGTEAEIKREIGANAYNVLKKRVADRLVDFMASLSLEKEASIEVQLIKWILVARKFLDNQQEKKGFKLLKRAEERALEVEQLTLLNEIYHAQIEYSHFASAPNQEELFEKLNQNTQRFLEQERLNMVFAMVRKAFIQNTAGDLDLDTILTDAFLKYGINKEVGLNYKILSQIAQIADISGETKKDYSTIDLFFVEKLEILEKKGEVRHSNYRIDLIYHVANIYFRRRDFPNCVVYLNLLNESIDPVQYPKHYVKYRNLEALYHNYIGHYETALSVLEPILNNNDHDATLNPRLVCMMIELQQSNFTAAKQHLRELTRSDRWYESTIGLDWTLHKKFLEIILLIELQESALLESRIQSLDRTYGQILKSNAQNNAYNFLKLIKQLVNNPHSVYSDKFKQTVEKTILWRPKEREDIFMISFYAWLKAKMEKRDCYTVTLELIEKK